METTFKPSPAEDKAPILTQYQTGSLSRNQVSISGAREWHGARRRHRAQAADA